MKRGVIMWLAWLPSLLHAAALQPLAAADLPALLKPPAHGERLIALWALDCMYCEANLRALARLQREHPDEISLVTVATDPYAMRAAIDRRLHEADVDSRPAYAYAESSPERLNYLLDPTWGGETPRVMVIDADGSRHAFSGALTPTQLVRLKPAKPRRAPADFRAGD